MSVILFLGKNHVCGVPMRRALATVCLPPTPSLLREEFAGSEKLGLAHKVLRTFGVPCEGYSAGFLPSVQKSLRN